VSCASELAKTASELSSARADLDRDEMIFAAKQQEIVSLQLALQESTQEAALLREEHDADVQRTCHLIPATSGTMPGETLEGPGKAAAELGDLALLQGIVKLPPQVAGTSPYHRWVHILPHLISWSCVYICK
jgi:hypothetical protein